MRRAQPGCKLVKSLFGKYEEIPEEWDYEKLLDNSSLKGRIGWQGLTTAEYRQNGEFFLVTGTDFKNGKIDWENCVYVDEGRYSQDKNIQLKKEDVLVTKDGTIGKIAYMDMLPQPATLNTGIFVIRPVNKGYFPLFFFYILYSNYFMKFLNRLKAGSTINHLYQKDFVNFHFPIPPRDEQQKIASILYNVDNLIDSYDKAIDNSKKQKKALMQQLLTKGNGHTKFKKVKWYFGKEIEIPIAWNRLPLSELGKLNAGGTPSRFTKEFWNNGTIPWISSGEIMNNRIQNANEKITKLGLKNSAAKLFPAGTLLIAITGFGKTRGRSSLLEIAASTNQSVIGLQTNEKIAHNQFVWFSLQNQYSTLRNFAQGSQQPGLNLEIVKSFKIFIPADISEQKKIASILLNADSKINELESKRSNLEGLKKGLMQKLLTGQIRVKA